MIKIAFFDIDGTLVPFDASYPTDKTAKALNKLKENGVKLCIATGRTPMTVPHFHDIEFDAYLTFNGSYCFEGEKELYSHPIPHEDVLRIIENASLIHRPVSIATKNRLGANGKDKDLVDYYAIAGVEVEVASDFDEMIKEDVYQIMMGGYESEYDIITKDVEGAKITAWWDRAVDIIPVTSGKGNAIKEILKYYNINQTEAIAFGDGNNDIEMLEAVGHGIAMGNASEALKEVADDICLSVNEDGIYYYCKEKGLI